MRLCATTLLCLAFAGCIRIIGVASQNEALAAQPISKRVPPAGSYEKTCRKVTFDGTTLRATCITQDEHIAPALLDVTGCRDDIRNMDGELTCSKGDSDPPKGSYYASCRSILVEGSAMLLTCQAGSGKWIHTSRFDFSSCRTDIANIDGQVICR